MSSGMRLPDLELPSTAEVGGKKEQMRDDIIYRSLFQVVSGDFLYFLGISTDVRGGRCPSLVSALRGWGGGKRRDSSIRRDVLSKLDMGLE
jgi:hypothetical protein